MPLAMGFWQSSPKNKVAPKICIAVSSFLGSYTAKRNYDEGHRELLTIKAALEEWRHWLAGSKYPFIIITDHKNHEYVKTPKWLSQPTSQMGPIFSLFFYLFLEQYVKECAIWSSMIVSPWRHTIRSRGSVHIPGLAGILPKTIYKVYLQVITLSHMGSQSVNPCVCPEIPATILPLVWRNLKLSCYGWVDQAKQTDLGIIPWQTGKSGTAPEDTSWPLPLPTLNITLHSATPNLDSPTQDPLRTPSLWLELLLLLKHSLSVESEYETRKKASTNL